MDEKANNMAAIVLAAGVSKRMGEENKLLKKFAGQSFIQCVVRAVCDAGVSEVVVVLGYERKQIQQQLDELTQNGYQRVRSVVNPDYEQGQMTSVTCGLEALVATTDGVLICLGDQPLLTASHIQDLVAAFESRKKGQQVIVPMFENQRGNPVVISEQVRQQVLVGESRLGCRRFIDDNPDLVTILAVNDAAYITDIDTQEEYRALTSL